MSCRRSSIWSARRSPGGLARPIAQAAARRHRHAADAGIYSEALYSRYHFGWSELYGLTDARYRLVRRRATSCTTSSAIRRKRPRSPPSGRRSGRRCEPRSKTLIGDTSIAAPSAVSDEDRQRLAALGYVGGGNNASLSLPGDSLPDPKDKVHVLEKYRHASDLAGALKFAEARRSVPGGARRRSRDDRRLAAARRGLLRQGMTAEAVHAYKEVIKRNPKDAGSLIGAGGGLLRLGRIDEAQTHASWPSASRRLERTSSSRRLRWPATIVRPPCGKRSWRRTRTQRCRCLSTSRACFSTTKATTRRPWLCCCAHGSSSKDAPSR